MATTEMRDPCQDPQRGDIVRATAFTNNRERHVTVRRNDTVRYTLVTREKSEPQNCSIQAWRQWCTHQANRVIVIKTGD